MGKKKTIELYQRPDGLYEKGMTINGKRVRFRGHDEKEILQKIANYKEAEAKGPLFKDIALDWRRAYGGEVEHYTYEKTTAAYNRVVEYFNKMYIRDITPMHINQFYEHLKAQKYAKKTVNNHRTVLSNIFKYAIKNNIVADNPTLKVSLPKKLSQNKRKLPSDEDIEKVKNNVDSPFGLFAYFLLYTGCRKGEALALQYKDIDRENKKISITKTVYYVGSMPCFKEPKTDSGMREIPLLDKLAPHIPKGKKDDYIFSKDGSAPYVESTFKREWKKYVEETGLNATPHQLRHAYATMLYEAGIDEKLAQELMGHADITTTRNIYTHIRLSRIDFAAAKLNDIDF